MSRMQGAGHRRVSWIAVALEAADDPSEQAISATIEFMAEWRVRCVVNSEIDWTGFDDACREHDGPWARRWLRSRVNSAA